MKESSIRFHSNPKLVWIATISYALLSFLLVAVIVIIGNNDLGRLITLDKSGYQYSGIMKKSIGRDDYYLFDAAIGFTCSRESNRGISAEVMMQTAESDYTDSINWNADKLSTYEIAISADIARTYGLKVGSVLYSRHIVDGNLYEYTVAQLLPCFPGIGSSNTNSYNNGVIIMGYDSRYELNVFHTDIFFTDESITDLTSRYSETPINIVYRDDLIAFTKDKLVPYIILLGVLGLVLTFAFFYALLHAVIYDYKRLIILGFREHDLNIAFNGYIIPPFVFAALCNAVLSVCLICLLGFSCEAIWFLIVLLIVELLTFIIAEFIAKWQVWRT